jgi:hypothetical protein
MMTNCRLLDINVLSHEFTNLPSNEIYLNEAYNDTGRKYTRWILVHIVGETFIYYTR